MPTLSEHETQAQSWGFQRVFTWTDLPNYHYPPHQHAALTTHLIVRGHLAVRYPIKTPDRKETLGPRGRIDVAAGLVHEIWIGSEGCTYVIGELLEDLAEGEWLVDSWVLGGFESPTL